MTFGNSFLAFPFKESDTEYFVTTCLTMNEIHDMELEIPTQGFNLHYDRKFAVPRVRNWNPVKQASVYCEAWDKKVEVTQVARPLSEKSWHRAAGFIKEVAVKQGHGSGSHIQFLDDVPGPSVAVYLPGQTPGAWDEQAEYAKVAPQLDWERILKERDGLARKDVPVFEGVQKPRPRPRI